MKMYKSRTVVKIKGGLKSSTNRSFQCKPNKKRFGLLTTPIFMVFNQHEFYRKTAENNLLPILRNTLNAAIMAFGVIQQRHL